MRPKAVVISASATPPVIAARDPEPPDADMPWNAVTIPIVVPSSPTNGAVAPVVSALGRVDVGRGNGGAVAQQWLHFQERLTEDACDVTLLVLFRQGDRAVELLFLQVARELGGEFPGLLLRLAQIEPLGNADRPRPGRHDEHDDHDAFGEKPHRCP